ncbi:MAG: cobyric acid synthase [Cytophagales bacterium]|nr:cobyric acid synthase [Cytophagales bacterium]
MQLLKPLMFVGTASDVGKSILCTAFCRIFKQDGYTPAPFKAQNMSLNSFATPGGFEIGRAQAVQAEAAGIPCHTDMNPVLLKPTGNTSSQVVLNGKPSGNQSAYSYFNDPNREHLFGEVKSAYNRLSERHNPIVMEGAGSIAELNLKSRDIVNMRMATHAGARVILVADIDRGGVFASVYGSVKLLPPAEQALVKGVIINKFRGDERLFDEGKEILQQITGKPVLGVMPYFTDITIDEEDSVAVDSKAKHPQAGKVNICVVRLPRMANYTDFSVFEHIKGVNLFYSDVPGLIRQADVILLPGSKNTIEDLIEIRKNGVAEALLAAYRAQKRIIGICGGYQMMGERVEDPDEVESTVPSTEGLGIFPIHTRILKDKTTLQRKFIFKDQGDEVCQGYEIHMGETHALEAFSPLNHYTDGGSEGCWHKAHCWGSYMHGIFDNKSVLQDLLKDFDLDEPGFDFHHYKAQQYDRLAALVREKIDVQAVYKFLRS